MNLDFQDFWDLRIGRAIAASRRFFVDGMDWVDFMDWVDALRRKGFIGRISRMGRMGRFV